MPQQFNNMNDLVEYLRTLEERVKVLETENTDLRAIQPMPAGVDEHAIAMVVSLSLPQTNLLHPGFLKRAFAVWDHFFVANLLIGLTVFVVMFGFSCLLSLLFGVSVAGLGR